MALISRFDKSDCLRRALLAAFVAFLSFCSGFAETVSDLPRPTTYVADFAGVIDPAAKAQMLQLAAELEREAHATLEIVTIRSLDGQAIEQFATDLEEKWRVGPKQSDRGVIMLFAIKEHKRRIEVGYGLEGVLNDAKVGDIGRSMVPDLREGDYGSAILGGERQLADDIARDAGVTLAPLSQAPHQQRPSRVRGVPLVPIVVFLLLLFSFFRRGRTRSGQNGRVTSSSWLPWFLIGNLLGPNALRGDDSFNDGAGNIDKSNSGDGDDGGFSGGFGGGSGGGGASGDW